MRTIAFFYALSCLTFCSCDSGSNNKSVRTDTSASAQIWEREKAVTQWEHFSLDTLVGRFSNRHDPDSVFLVPMSRLTREKIDSLPLNDTDPYDTYWLDSLEVATALCMKGIDTLWLRPFVYCAIDVSTPAKNKLHALAIADDSRDMSTLGSCHIYKLAGKEWKEAISFSIHQSVFFVTPDEASRKFTEIPGFLEKKKGNWYYSAYLEDQDGYPQVWHKLSLK